MAVPAIVNLFPHQASTVTDPNQGYRVFKIEKSTGVDLPGCVSVTEVRLDGRPIPQFVDEKVNDDLTFQNYSKVRVPLWSLVEGTNGPMLLRSLKSNDGAWQVGSHLSIKGEWSDGTDELEGMTVAELRSKADGMGLVEGSAYISKPTLISLIRGAIAAN